MIGVAIAIGIGIERKRMTLDAMLKELGRRGDLLWEEPDKKWQGRKR